jgi:protein arginine N-methyltransferase 1
MLGDTVRKRAFLDAIDEIVGPDDVVLDLGTGSGILAVAAARAGARHVYAIEPSSFVAMAEQVARDNGVADRITFIRGWSSNAELPEPATVLTTDIIGNESLDMRIWETLDDARRRLMAPGGRLIPASVTASACLVCAPADVLRQYKPDDELVSEWKADYGIDFGAFARASAEQSLSFHVEPHVARDWPVLSDPVTVYELDLSTAPTPIDVTRTLTVHEPGMANALLSFFEARLSPSSVLSTAPADGSDRSHWFSACWTLPRPIEVRPGDRLSFRYEYRGDGRSAVSPAPAPSPATSEAVA